MSAKQNARSLKPAKNAPGSAKDQNSRSRQPSGRISAACEACKKRKTKCSGHPPPCQMCEQLDTPCVIDLTLDLRRRTALQRTMEESRVFQETLNELIGILRSGDDSDIEDLVTHVQQNPDDENFLEALQTKLHERHGSGSGSLERQSKDDANDSDDDEDAKSALTFDQGLTRKRTFSMQGDESPRSLPYLARNGSTSTTARDDESLGSRYLPLISRLRNVTDVEATRILHDFWTSPVSPNGGAASNLSDRRDSRPQLDIPSGQYERKAAAQHNPGSVDRTNWHPSLQVRKPSFQSPLAGVVSQGLRSEPVSARHTPYEPSLYSVHSNSGATGITTSSDSGAARSSRTSISDAYLSMSISTASQEHQSRSATYTDDQSRTNPPSLELFGDIPALWANNSRVNEYAAQSSATIPAYLIQSRLLLEDSPLSKVFTGFRDAARHMIATGTPPYDIINGSDVVVDLFFRDRWPSDGFTCSAWACEVGRSFGEVDDVLRLACVFLQTRLMRWMIYPTQETFEEIPECQRPTPTQCFIPHMPAIDLHPVPAMRDVLCHTLQDWMTGLGQQRVSCNWPFTIDEALDTDPLTGSIKVSKAFGEHVSNSENWTYNSSGVPVHPELAGKVKIRDD